MSREEIIEYASRYCETEEKYRFPMNGELFCFIEREVPADKPLSDDEGWQFGGYGLCIDYELDNEAKPAGKWIWFRFLTLQSFPPAMQELKLQPPHIVKGRFQNPDRTRETRIVGIPLDALVNMPQGEEGEVPEQKPAKPKKAKILKFPGEPPAKT
jgi:hypothetical protein